LVLLNPGLAVEFCFHL